MRKKRKILAIVLILIAIIGAGLYLWPKADGQDYSKGKTVLWGRYPQQSEKPEPIEWLVLDNDGKQALLISKFGLDCMPFNNVKSGKAWRDSDLRAWLNDDFLKKAFTVREVRRIAESEIDTPGNPEFGTEGCGKTIDRIFCLSIDEANKYFGADSEEESKALGKIKANRSRACLPTALAMSRGAKTVSANKELRDALGIISDQHEWWFDNCVFWLRSPGHDAYYAARVDDIGTVCSRGLSVYGDSYAVRPALRIKL
ncbi:MAG: DUF6273 domain-containing protein [bacterium]|nr:DUF6273 domain-containing protein [bacterium]